MPPEIPLATTPGLAHDHRPNAAAPVVAYGDDAILRVPQHVATLGAQRVLLVCGKRSFNASGAAAMLPALEAAATVLRWSDFAPNTDSADLVVGLEEMRAFDPDLVLGIGGGSALDMAKLLVAFQDVRADEVPSQIRDSFKATKRRTRLMLVPTTSGSGAEATHFAVVYIGNDKYSIGGEGMRPDAICLDPRLAQSGTAYQRATSGIDAVCQAIESLWAADATERSRHFARVGLRVLMPAIETFVNEPDDESAHAMTIGSHFAGRAIDISRTTAAHALAYGITKGYGISHGHAVAMTLGAFIEEHASVPAARLQPTINPDDHTEAMNLVMGSLGAETGQSAHRLFTKLLVRIGLDPSLAHAGATSSESRRALAAVVNAERLGNNPVHYSASQLAALVDTM